MEFHVTLMTGIVKEISQNKLSRTYPPAQLHHPR